MVISEEKGATKALLQPVYHKVQDVIGQSLVLELVKIAVLV